MSYTLEIHIEEGATTHICSSCKRPFIPGEGGVEFTCPNCGRAIIRRCKKCRKLNIEYTCPNCGFRGP